MSIRTAIWIGTAAALFGGVARAQDKIVKIDGSSTVFPITEAVAEDFQKEAKGVKVTVGISGTGGGFKKFCRGETDISDASRPITAEEMKSARDNGIEYIELPIAFDALTVAVNPKNTWVDFITVDELRVLWEPAAQGKITKWSQVRAGWPDEKIELFGAGSDSGTFDYFTEAVVGKARSSRGDYVASEDDNVLVRGIEGNKFSLGYVPFSYFTAQAGRMKAVSIKWEKGKIKDAVAPSLDAVIEGRYNPLSRPLFLYVNRKSAETKPWVREFVDFYLKHAPDLVKEVKYVPLPSEAYAMGQARFKAMKVGTGFGGHNEVGMSIQEILRREPTMDVKAPTEGKDGPKK